MGGRGPVRIAWAATVAMSTGLTAIVALVGFSPTGWIKAVETLAVVIFGGALLAGVVGLVFVRLGGWGGAGGPASEEDFDRVVLRAERLAADGLAAEPDEAEFMALDPYEDRDFEALVGEALDELPDLLKKALDHNVAVVISDEGRRHRAYGLYQGDGANRDTVTDRIVIFRDTLRRDFGHDGDMLREQVLRTVRHELAHHIGFDELGVQGLGL
jgi:predicted Zn-dependent protease with MMP-like domain